MVFDGASSNPLCTIKIPLLTMSGLAEPPLGGRPPDGPSPPRGNAHSVLSPRLVRRTCSYVRCSPARTDKTPPLRNGSEPGAPGLSGARPVRQADFWIRPICTVASSASSSSQQQMIEISHCNHLLIASTL